MAEWRPATDLALPHLEDLKEVREASGTSGAITYVKATGVAALVAVEAAPEGTLTLGNVNDSGTFTHSASFNYNQFVLVPANSKMLVQITAHVGSDSGITVGSDTLPTPWTFAAADSTGDPGGLQTVGGSGTGVGRAQAFLWCENDTDDDALHEVVTVTSSCAPTFTSSSYVGVYVRFLYYL